MLTLEQLQEDKSLVWMIRVYELYAYPWEGTQVVIDIRNYKDSEGIWHIYPIAHNNDLLYVLCPLCDSIHAHEWRQGNHYGPCIPLCNPCPEDVSYYVLNRP